MKERTKKLLRIVTSNPAQVGEGFTIRRPMPGNGIEGFETVTVVLQGEIAHRDSAGHSGLLGAGGVQ